MINGDITITGHRWSQTQFHLTYICGLALLWFLGELAQYKWPKYSLPLLFNEQKRHIMSFELEQEAIIKRLLKAIWKRLHRHPSWHRMDSSAACANYARPLQTRPITQQLVYHIIPICYSVTFPPQKKKIPYVVGDLDPDWIHGFLGQFNQLPQMASWSSQLSQYTIVTTKQTNISIKADQPLMCDTLNAPWLLTNRQFQWTGNGHSQLPLAELNKPSPNIDLLRTTGSNRRA